MRNKKYVLIAVISFVLILAACFFLVFGAHKGESSLSDDQKAGIVAITAEAKRISIMENPTFNDILELAKRGGKVESCAIFYSDMWNDPDPKPFTFMVDYKEGIKIEIRNMTSLSVLYQKLYNTLVGLHRIEGTAN